MSTSMLSHHISIRRRFMRSVNLERDSNLADSLDGYILTSQARETLVQILGAYSGKDHSRAWTLTGVYGTGKSAFANFLSALHAPKESEVRKRATALIKGQTDGSALVKTVNRIIPTQGYVRAIVTGQREPVTLTVLRCLTRGAREYWQGRPGRNPAVIEQLEELLQKASAGQSVAPTQITELVVALATASNSGLLIIIDELGKLLEHAGQSGGKDDLFLLQQLAELHHTSEGHPISVIALLHQSFSEYGTMLSASERMEWEKVQGRFHDIPFAESPDQMLRLIEQAIESDFPSNLDKNLKEQSAKWHQTLKSLEGEYFQQLLPPERIIQTFPLHPVATAVLPTICTRYGQNDRSLFTFLASSEPHGLLRFVQEREVSSKGSLPLLQLTDVYEYFVAAARIGTSNRNQYARWAEIHNLIHDAVGLSEPELQALKVIGTLNLVASTGPLRAGRALVLTALCTEAGNTTEEKTWDRVLNKLLERRIVTYRKQVDEFRLWQGSDFDVENILQEYLADTRTPLASILSQVAPLPPMIAHRHSYRTGSLRYFEQSYREREDDLIAYETTSAGSDGAVIYWLGKSSPKQVPAITRDGKPLVVVSLPPSARLIEEAQTVFALQAIQGQEPAIQTDGVARKEVRQRLSDAKQRLDAVIQQLLSDRHERQCWLGGDEATAANISTALSAYCDKVYSKSPIIHNELINRRDLSSQGSRAQREVITALLTRSEEEGLGISGNGPDYSIYVSLLLKNGIHINEGDKWTIKPPINSATKILWKAIEDFCLSATTRAQPLSDLYDVLQATPYGVKPGVIPVFLAAVLLYHSDDVSVYLDGTFLPVLEAHHFELLLKNPGRFALKYFEIQGVRWELFRELEAVVRERGAERPTKARNATLLTVVRPLVQFAATLPRVTQQATDLSEDAINVRDTLLSVREPDRLIFEALPEALGYAPFTSENEEKGEKRHEQFRHALFTALRELQMYYERLLEKCLIHIHKAFGVQSDRTQLREDLRVRASYLAQKVVEPRLKSFIVAAADADSGHQRWLEALAMVIADQPVEAWKKDDRLVFEMNVADFARRFANLESLQHEAVTTGVKNHVARRITITEPTGNEVHRLVWINEEEQKAVESKAQELLEGLKNINESTRQGVIVALIEQMLKFEPAAQQNVE